MLWAMGFDSTNYQIIMMGKSVGGASVQCIHSCASCSWLHISGSTWLAQPQSPLYYTVYADMASLRSSVLAIVKCQQRRCDHLGITQEVPVCLRARSAFRCLHACSRTAHAKHRDGMHAVDVDSGSPTLAGVLGSVIRNMGFSGRSLLAYVPVPILQAEVA